MHQKVKESGKKKKKHGKEIEDGRCAVWESPMGSSVEYGSKSNTTKKNGIFGMGTSFRGEITDLVSQALMYWFEVIAINLYMTPQ